MKSEQIRESILARINTYIKLQETSNVDYKYEILRLSKAYMFLSIADASLSYSETMEKELENLKSRIDNLNFGSQGPDGISN